jgi:hypothetical protein
MARLLGAFIRVPTTAMTKWISQLLFQAGLLGKEEELPCIVRLVEDGVRMSLLEFPETSEQSGYRIELEFWVEPLGLWVEIATFKDFNLDASIAQLTRAQRCIRNLAG